MTAAGTQVGPAGFEIGGVHVGLRVVGHQWAECPLPQSYGEFALLGGSDLSLTLRAEPYDGPLPPPVFRSGVRWSLHLIDGAMVVITYAGALGAYQALVYQPESRRADVHLQSLAFGDRPYTVDIPLMQILYVMMQDRVPSALMHGCAIVADGTGLAFIGESGAGKSTLSQLWIDSGLGTVLCDDRIIFRQSEGGYRLHGTPWHGDVPSVSSCAPALDRVFLIKHGSANGISRLSRADVVASLMRCIFPPWWDAHGMSGILGFLDRLVAQVPCYELSFVPTADAPRFVLDNLDA
ncbi:MAG: hypothetical protein GXX94_05620 [Chloroflexi bacterium]|nr:hypothetical protein [Chloroflexota bacterium]